MAARTRQQWETAVASGAAALGLSNSAVANWKLWRDLVISVAMLLESIWLKLKGDVDETLRTKQPGTLTWYAYVAKLYQNGYSLTVNNGIAYYADSDPGSMIVAYASVRESESGVVKVKVAKNASGAPAPIDGGDLSAFKDYMNARRMPGTRLNCYSYAADEVDYELYVQYSPYYNYVQVNDAIVAALNNYRDNFPFDAQLYYNRLINVVMDVPGVVNVLPTSDITLYLSDGTTIIGFTTVQELPAGYFTYGGGSTLTLTPTL